MDGHKEWKRVRRQRSQRPRRAGRTLGVAVIMALALTACGGDGSGGLPTSLPTGLPTTLPSVTLPTVTLPTVTLPTLPSVTLPTLPTPTLPTATAEPPASPEPTPETTDPGTAAPPAVDEEDAETTDPEADEDGSGWLWLLLLLLVAAAVAATALLLRRRRERAAWSEAVEEPLREATWLRDSIIPNLLAQDADGRAGIWAIGRPRVLTLEQRLGDLVTKAPDPATVRHVGALSAAVQALRRALDHANTLVGFGGNATTAALQQSQHELDEAIRPLQPLSEQGTEAVPAAPPPDGRP